MIQSTFFTNHNNVNDHFPHELWLSILTEAAQDPIAFKSIPRVCKSWHDLFNAILDLRIIEVTIKANKIIEKARILQKLDPQIDKHIKNIYKNIPKTKITPSQEEKIAPSQVIKTCDFILMDSLGIKYQTAQNYQKLDNFDDNVSTLKNSDLIKDFKNHNNKDQQTIFSLMALRFRAADPAFNQDILSKMNFNLVEEIQNEEISPRVKHNCFDWKNINKSRKNFCTYSFFAIGSMTLLMGALIAFGDGEKTSPKIGYPMLGVGGFFLAISIYICLLDKILNKLNANKEKSQHSYFNNFLQAIDKNPSTDNNQQLSIV